MIILGMEVTNHTPFDFNGGRGGVSNRAGKWIRELKKVTLIEMAEKYHEELMPNHFLAGGPNEYGMQSRSDFYKTEIKPRKGVAGGKNPNISLNLTGESMRAILYGGLRITGNHNMITSQTGTPPSYFRNPFIGVIGKKSDGTTRVITQQPDKMDEVKRISSGDEQMLRRFASDKVNPAIKAMNRRIKKQVKKFK